MRTVRVQRNEDGDTLLEILITIVILSFGVLGIYATLTSSIVAADQLKGRADASQLAARVADVIQRADWECGEPRDSLRSPYAAALNELKPTVSWTIEVTAVRHWGPSRAFEEGCPKADDDPLFRLLKLTVLVKAPGGRGQQLIEVIKRP